MRPWAAVLLALCACGLPDEGVVELPQPSRAVFAETAGPILEKRCCVEGSCHGVAERPYALYAVGRRRMEPADTYAATPLTAGEVEANYQATLGFIDAARGRDTTLVRKALAVGGAGGHRGGAVFEAPSDPECLAIIGWIESRPW